MPQIVELANTSCASVIARIGKDFLGMESFADPDPNSGRRNYRAVYVERVGDALRAAYDKGYEARLRSQQADRPVEAPDPSLLVTIAMEELHIETLVDELWRQDREDYRAVHAPEVERALRRAYRCGFEAAGPASRTDHAAHQEDHVKIELKVPAERIIDAIMSGLDGGIQHWARVASWGRPAQTAARAEIDGVLRFACELIEHDTGERTALSTQWMTGLRRLAERYPQRFAELVDGSGDARTGDVFIQLTAFGELRYG